MPTTPFQNQDRFISDRAFWVGAIVYFAFCIGAVAAFGNTFPTNGLEIVGPTNNSGSLVFAGDPVRSFAADRLDIFHGYPSSGAVTLRSHGLANFRQEPNWARHGQSIVDPAVGRLSDAAVNPCNLNTDPQRTSLSGNDAGTTALQIALGERTGFVADSIAPVPEPATWFAAALVACGIIWSQRRRITRLVFPGKRIAIFTTGIFFVFTFGSFGAINENNLELGSFDRGTNSPLSENEPVIDGRQGLIGFAATAKFFGDFTQMGAPETGASSMSVILTENQNLTVIGGPGETITLSLKNFRMSDSSTFTLQGTTTTMFVINVSKQFSLSGSAQIVLAGGVQWSNVTFNVLGKKGPVTLSDNSRFSGVVNAPGRMVNVSDQATVYGKIYSRKLVVSGNAQVVSPEQPPSP